MPGGCSNGVTGKWEGVSRGSSNLTDLRGDLMDDTPRPPCPKCKSESVYRVIIDVIIEHVGKQRWHCATCKYEWPVSEEGEQLDPSR